MEFSLKQNSISCFDKIISQNITREVTQETVVPDTMPDIAEILDTAALFMIRSKDISVGCVRIEGNLSVTVLYRPETDVCACNLEFSVPVSVVIEDEKIQNNFDCCAKLYISSIECRITNPRKIFVKLEVCGNISCYESCEQIVNSDAVSENTGVFLQKKTATVTPVKDVREKTFVVTDEYTLPQTKLAAERLLSNCAQLLVEEIKFSGGKLILKGNIICCVTFIDTDAQFCVTEFTTPFSQVLDAPVLSYEIKPEIFLMLTGAYFELLSGGDNRTFNSEFHLLAQIVSREKEELCYVADSYSNSHELQMQMKAITAQTQVLQSKFRQDYREFFESMLQIKEIVKVSALAGNAEQKSGSLSLPVYINIIYLGVDSLLHGIKRRADLKFELAADERTVIDVISPKISNVSAEVASGGVELRATAEIEVGLYKKEEIIFVDSVDCNEEVLDLSNKPSLTIIKACSNDDLWQIAKENCSSVESICQANKLDDGQETWEKYILIPKTK